MKKDGGLVQAAKGARPMVKSKQFINTGDKLINQWLTDMQRTDIRFRFKFATQAACMAGSGGYYTFITIFYEGAN